MRIHFAALTPLLLSTCFATDPGELKVSVYPVADLVSSPAQTASLNPLLLQQANITLDAVNSLAGNESAEERAIAANLDELVGLIQTIAVPDDWDQVGGAGRIASHRKTLSLVIRQTESGHAEIHELLEQLRRQNNITVEVTLEYLEQKIAHRHSVLSPSPNVVPVAEIRTPSPEGYIAPRTGQTNTSQTKTPPRQVQIEDLDEIIQELSKVHGPSMNDKELAEFRKRISPAADVSFLQTIQLANGRSRLVAVVSASATSVISTDRRHVDLYLANFLTGGQFTSARIPDGESVLLKILDEDGDSYTLLAKAKIKVIEEPEEQLVPAKR